MKRFVELTRTSLTKQAVEQILDMIRPEGGIYKPGERLPSEREMAMSMGISRPALREALAVLVVSGALERKPGSGTYIPAQAPPDNNTIIVNLEMLNREAPFQVMEARKLLEPECAALAALRALPVELAELESLLAKADAQASRGEWVQTLDCDFHVTLARATRNPVVCAVVEYLCHTWFNEESPWKGIKLEGLERPQRLAYIRKTHRDVYEAVARHDARGGRTAMKRHLARFLAD